VLIFEKRTGRQVYFRCSVAALLERALLVKFEGPAHPRLGVTSCGLVTKEIAEQFAARLITIITAQGEVLFGAIHIERDPAA
jgi:hypothetical protein